MILYENGADVLVELTIYGRILCWLQRVKKFVKGEVVLSAAIVLALLSAIAVPPDAAWAGYIDWDTLALLFSLMAVTKGLQQLGLFDALGASLLRRMATTRRMVLVLVFLPFFFSMLITNDVSLITFVPFALTVLHMAGQDRLVIPTVVLQTAAANLGSMLTPMGNPQNLYLYNRSGMSFGEFCALMLPYVVVSGVCIGVLGALPRSVPVHADLPETQLGDKRKLALCAVGAVLCLGCIAKVLSPLGVAAVTAVVLIIGDRKLLARIDYSLLGPSLPSLCSSATWAASRASRIFCPASWPDTRWRWRCWPARSSATCPRPCSFRGTAAPGPGSLWAATWAGWVPSSPPWPA